MRKYFSAFTFHPENYSGVTDYTKKQDMNPLQSHQRLTQRSALTLKRLSKILVKPYAVCSCEGVLHEFNIWICRLSKVGCLPSSPQHVASSHQLKALIQQNSELLSKSKKDWRDIEAGRRKTRKEALKIIQAKYKINCQVCSTQIFSTTVC